MAVLLLTVVVVAIGYAVHCKLFPYARCRPCDGKGTSVGSNRKRWNNCRVCHGSGRRERLGARLLRRR